jgi:hypothetical protein
MAPDAWPRTTGQVAPADLDGFWRRDEMPWVAAQAITKDVVRIRSVPTRFSLRAGVARRRAAIRQCLCIQLIRSSCGPGPRRGARRARSDLGDSARSAAARYREPDARSERYPARYGYGGFARPDRGPLIAGRRRRGMRSPRRGAVRRMRTARRSAKKNGGLTMTRRRRAWQRAVPGLLRAAAPNHRRDDS